MAYNLRSPAVKRLMKEAQELRQPTEEYYAQPLDDNLFEWHFTVRGPPESDFDNGCYHGRIILPTEYPMKPPSIIILTPNGRFEVNKKICLSISGHHPESWQPSWSIRTALLAIIGFMPTESLGAIGSLNYSSEERKSLAVKSQSWKCPSCGLIKPLLKETSPNSGKTTDSDATREAKELAKQIRFKGTESDTASSKTNSAESIQSPSPSPSNSIGSASIGKDESETIRQRIVAISNNVDTSVHSGVQQNFSQRIEEETTTGINRTTVEQSGTRLSTYCIVVLTVAIAFLLFRRLFL